MQVIVWIFACVFCVRGQQFIFSSSSGSGTACSQNLPCSLPQAVSSATADAIIRLSAEVFSLASTVTLSLPVKIQGSNGTSIRCTSIAPAFVVAGPTVVFETVLFVDCSTAVDLLGGASSVIHDCIFEQCTGPCVLVTANGAQANRSSLLIERSIFRNNAIILPSIGLYNGGAALQARSTNGLITVVISTCEFRNNSVVSTNGDFAQGGAISFAAFNAPGANLTITDSLFSRNFNNNTCTASCGNANGGAILFDAEPNGILDVARTKFLDNAAYDDGGAIALNGICKFNSVLFERNAVFLQVNQGGVGGALFAKGTVGTVLTLANVTFRNNSATLGGAMGIWSVNSLSFTCTDCFFFGNTAKFTDLPTSYGGALLVDTASNSLAFPVRLQRCSFCDNRATNNMSDVPMDFSCFGTSNVASLEVSIAPLSQFSCASSQAGCNATINGVSRSCGGAGSNIGPLLCSDRVTVADGSSTISSPLVIAGNTTIAGNIVINASVIVQNGATLTITGALTIQPGASLTVQGGQSGQVTPVVAQSIAGQFSVVNATACAVSSVAYASLSVTVDISCSGLSTGAIVGICVTGVALVAVVVSVSLVVWRRKTHERKRRALMDTLKQEAMRPSPSQVFAE